MKEMQTAILVKLKEMLKTIPEDITKDVIKNYVKLIETIDIQNRTLIDTQKDFRELYVMLTQIVLEAGGQLKIKGGKIDPMILTNYRIIKDTDKRTKEITFDEWWDEVYSKSCYAIPSRQIAESAWYRAQEELKKEIEESANNGSTGSNKELSKTIHARSGKE
jgi:hypothetical protein